jgi:diguanylate cyclase (GGDEF)-like protein
MRDEVSTYARAVTDPFSDRQPAQVLGRLVDAIGLHVFIAEVVDGVYREIYTGPGVEELMGGPVPPGIELDDAWPERVHPDDWSVYAEAMHGIHGGEPGDVEYRMVGYDGVTRVVWERGRPWLAPDGRLVIDGFALDVTDQKRAEHELQVVLERLEVERAVADRRARIDSLTGVYNRSHLAEVIEIELERAVREGTTPGVFLIDLDHFKRVNDTYGHLPGDAVLVQAAARIRRSVRSYDCVARWGGEEFAVIVPVVASDDALRSIGEGLRRAIAAEPFEADGALLSLTASVGCVRAGRDRWTAEALVAAADRALYEAKDGGRNRTRTAHDAPSDAPATADAGIETIARALALAAAIRDGRPIGRAHRAAELAGMAAFELGLDLRGCGRTSVAALLADAGPVSIDERERTSLTADRVGLADHALAVEDVVRRVAGLQDVAAVLRHQHERYDGSGVPDALAGTDIAIEARIVAAAVILAATDDPAALAPLAGGVLDPSVVEAMRAAVAR